MGIDLDTLPFEDECWQYIYDVLAGAFVTSGKIRHLCGILAKRAGGYKRWHYDPDKARRAVSFIEKFCCLTTGQPGRPLKLEPFQKFIVMTLFGWVDDRGKRQFQEAIVLIARKCGKSELAAAISLYMLLADGEYGVQGYFAGVTEPQAALCYGAAQKMMRQSPSLS